MVALHHDGLKKCMGSSLVLPFVDQKLERNTHTLYIYDVRLESTM
jgi:hypothetical protein